LEKIHGAVFTCTAGDILEEAALQKDPKLREIKTQGLLEAFALLKYDAIALGETDLAAGPAFLENAKAKHGLRFVCANAYGPGKKRLADPYVIAEKNGVRVAFIGVVSPERHVVAQSENKLLEHKINLKDPTEEVTALLPEVRGMSDVVVLLAHTGIETAEFLAKDLAVDVVIVGHYPAIENDPRKVGNAVFCMAGAKSDRFGTLNLTLGESGSGIKAFEGDAIRLLKTGPEVPEIAAVAMEADKKEKELNHEKQLALQRDADAAALKKKSSRVHELGGILGAESCKQCHQPTYDSWLETPHAQAFAKLAEADAWDDPECIGCHVTGVAEKHYVGASIPPERWNVQCEECHGSGLDHARDGSYVTSGEATCVKCHDTQNSPEFEFELYSSYGVH
jgi:hypothetical protein